MCLLRSRRNAAFRCIMSRVRIRIRLHAGMVYMKSFFEDMDIKIE